MKAYLSQSSNRLAMITMGSINVIKAKCAAKACEEAMSILAENEQPGKMLFNIRSRPIYRDGDWRSIQELRTASLYNDQSTVDASLALRAGLTQLIAALESYNA